MFSVLRKKSVSETCTFHFLELCWTYIYIFTVKGLHQSMSQICSLSINIQHMIDKNMTLQMFVITRTPILLQWTTCWMTIKRSNHIDLTNQNLLLKLRIREIREIKINHIK